MSNFPPEGFVPAPSSIAGIEVFAPSPRKTAAQPEVVEFKCPRCGATTAYHAGESALTCMHCGYSEGAQQDVVGKRAAENEFTTAVMLDAGKGWGEERKQMACSHCGAVVSLPFENLSHTCAFCGSNQVTQRPEPQDVLRPGFLIPFCLETAGCKKIASQWLGSSWLTPADLTRAVAIDHFTAIYLPFWTFDSVTRAQWKAEVGHHETRRHFENGEWKEQVVVVWRWENGQVQLDHDDQIVPGAQKISRLLLSKVDNFNLNELVAFDAKYLAGLQAQAYTVNLEEAWETGRQAMREKTRQACLKQASTGQVRNFSMELDFSDESWRYLLLPVYLSSYPFQGQDLPGAGQWPNRCDRRAAACGLE